jgi:hypothetical protein
LIATGIAEETVKALNTCVTILVTFILLAILGATPAAQAAGRSKPAPPPPPSEDPPIGATFTLKTQGQQTVNPGSYPNAFVAMNLEYVFYKSISLAVDESYFRAFREIDKRGEDGIADPVISLTDKALWVNKYYGLSLKGSLALLLPVSTPSKVAGMIAGGGASLTLKKEFTSRFSLSFITSGMTYYYDYDTAYEDAKTAIYNTHFMIANRVLATFDVTKTFHWSTQASVLTYNNLENKTYSTYIVSTGMSYDMTDNVALDLGVRSGYKDHEAPITWNGPTTADRPFNGEGVTLYLGLTLKI